MFPRVQVQQKLDQRAFQPSAPIRVEQEPAPGQFRAAGEIHQLQGFAKLHMRLGFKREVRLLAPNSDLRIILGRFPLRDTRVWQVRQAQENLVAGCFRLGHLLIQGRNLIPDRAGLRFFGFGFGSLLLSHEGPNLLGYTIPQAFELFHLTKQLTTLLIQLDKFGNLDVVPCPAGSKAFPHKIWFLTNDFDIQHRRIIEMNPVGARSNAPRRIGGLTGESGGIFQA